MNYSVLENPIVSVIKRNGEEVEVSLKDAVLRAHEYADIGGDNPLERYSSLRFLSAFVMDMLEMRTADDRRRVFEAGKFNDAQFNAYVKKCIEEGVSFDLFDKDRPFMQIKATAEEMKKIKNSACLDLSAAAGNNHAFCQKNGGVRGYSVEEDVVMTASKSFRAMITRQCFCGASTEGPSGATGTPLYVYAIGNDLFETIMLHALSEEEVAPRTYGLGTVSWRSDKQVIYSKEKPEKEATLLEVLTWRPRRIQLFADAEGKVRKAVLKKGLNYEGTYIDPNMVAYKNPKNGVIASVGVDMDIDPWVNIANIVAGDKNNPQPDALRCMKNVYGEAVPENVALRVCGLDKEAQNYKLYGWQEQDMILPECLLKDEETAKEFRRDLRMMALVSLAVSDIVGKNNVTYLSMLDRREKEIAFDLCMTDAKQNVPKEEHETRVCEAVESAAEEVVENMYRNCGHTVRDMLETKKAVQSLKRRVEKAIEKRKKGEETNERGRDNGTDKME